MKTKNILLLSGIGLIAFVIYKKSSKPKPCSCNSNVPASNSLTITPIADDSSNLYKGGIYLGYPTVMKP